MKAESVKREKSSTVLRRLLNEPGCLTTIWGGTAHHAQLAAYAGFKAFGISGSKTSSWIYGLPDAGYITQTELVENVRNICNAHSRDSRCRHRAWKRARRPSHCGASD